MNADAYGEQPEWSPEELLRENAAETLLYPDRFKNGTSTSGNSSVSGTIRNKRTYIFLVALAVFVAIAVAIAIPLAMRAANAKASNNASDGDEKQSLTKGANGSWVTTENGETFMYLSEFGGDWAYDPEKPFDDGGQSQKWSKRVAGVNGTNREDAEADADTWVWGRDVIRGVNLAGWLVTQPFVTPSLYEKYIGKGPIPVIDEWSLSLAMGSNLVPEMEEHYKTFITERDFAEIAGAGLNYVRIPLGFWAIETRGAEPFLEGVSWKYFLKAIIWARKYGLRIYLDFHGLPGSQNGWDHSGRNGTINVMNGVMGIANAQRSLTYLRVLAQFISQEQYKEVVTIIGVANDVRWDQIGQQGVQSFYYAAYDTIRKVSGLGAGKGPMIAIHDGFQGVFVWEGYLEGADRLALDQHPYLPFEVTEAESLQDVSKRPCEWALATNRSMETFGVTLGGQFSAAINDCGLWANGIDTPSIYQNCSPWDDWTSWDENTIAILKQATLASMDALQNWFFYTWKIGNSTAKANAGNGGGRSTSPMWDYKLGLERGWIPKDPREAIGQCASILGNSSQFHGAHPGTATGGAGAGTISPSQTVLHAFPPSTLALAPSPLSSGFGVSPSEMSLLPTYTPTGSLKTLAVPTFTKAPQDLQPGTGWANPNDSADGAYVSITGCLYPDPWNAVDVPIPVAPC